MFRIGDKVRVIHNNAGMRFGRSPKMDQFVGRITEIKSARDGCNNLEIDDGLWSWDDRSLEHVNTPQVGDVIRWNPGKNYQLMKKTGDSRFDLVCLDTGKEFSDCWIKREIIDIGIMKMIKKYPLRNAKGLYIKCDRYINPLEAAVKRRKPVAKGMVAEAAPKAAIMAKKPLPEPPKAKDIRSELAKLARVGYDGDRCNYSIEFDNGMIRHQAPDACHARLCWNNWGEKDKKAKAIVNIALNITAHHKKFDGKKKEIHTRFVHYMLNDSPWADCFITKDVKEALEVGILMNVEKNVSHIVGAAVALRVATEWEVVLKPFGDVLDKGYSGNVAYLCCGHLMAGNVTAWPHHSALTSTLGLADIIEFFKNGYSQKDWKGIANDKRQTSYQIFSAICPGSGYGGLNPNGGDSLSKFTNKQAVSTKQGEGFEAKTVFDYEATLIKMADAFTEELK